MTEAWLSGPVPDVPPLLQPVAHALLNASQQLTEALDGLQPGELVQRPGNAASIAYHVVHAIGSLDRLFTYARGEGLSDEQRAALKSEASVESENSDAAALLRDFEAAVERAMRQLRETKEGSLLEPRGVGRAKLPSTVIGLLFHGGEHTVRHTGQVVTTAKVVRAARG
jgi:uncharacterized damage-inducible protein DinB